MNTTVDLVNEWAKFESRHPNAGIEEFCRYYLLQQKAKQKPAKFLGDVLPPGKSSLLTKLLVKLVRIYDVYIAVAIRDLKIRQPEEFYFLSVIKNLKSPKKTEVIYHTVNELSNGLNIVNSLLKQGYITEQQDRDDMRAKRVSLTAKGEKILKQCYDQIHKVSELMFLEMHEDEIMLCIQLLKRVEGKFSDKWLIHKNKSFDEIYHSVMNEKESNKKK
jgi:DNA-binding MarR family transcriptional regulator